MPAAIHWTDHVKDVAAANFGLLTGGGTTAHTNDVAYPSRDLQDDDPSLKARFNVTRDGTVGATTVLRLRWSTVANDRTMRAISALNVRLPPGTTDVQARAITFAGAVLESGAAYTAADLVPLAGFTDRYNLHWLLSQDRAAGGIEFVAKFPASASNYYEIGRLRTGPAIVLPDGTARDWALGFVDDSHVERTPGGSISAQPLTVRQKIRAPVRRTDYNLTMGTPGSASVLNFRRMFLECGKRTPVVFMQRSSSQHALQTHSIYCSLTQLRDVTHERGNKYALEIEGDEIR